MLSANESTPIYFYYTVILCIGGTLFNGMACWYYFRILRSTRLLGNALLFSLFLTDFLQSLLGYSLNAVHIAGVPGTDDACRVSGFIVHWLSISSLAHCTVLSILRYRVISNNCISERSTTLKIVSVLSLPYLYSMIWSVAPFMGWSQYGTTEACAINWRTRTTNNMSYIATILHADFLLPLIVIQVAYFKLRRVVKACNQHLSSMEAAASTELKKRKAREHRTTVTVIMIVVIFLLAWLPYALAVTLVFAGVPIPEKGVAIPAFFAKASVLYNPIVYSFRDMEFRKFVKAKFTTVVSGASPLSSLRKSSTPNS